jgi:hypothetical protein
MGYPSTPDPQQCMEEGYPIGYLSSQVFEQFSSFEVWASVRKYSRRWPRKKIKLGFKDLPRILHQRRVRFRHYYTNDLTEIFLSQKKVLQVLKMVNCWASVKNFPSVISLFFALLGVGSVRVEPGFGNGTSSQMCIIIASN